MMIFSTRINDGVTKAIRRLHLNVDREASPKLELDFSENRTRGYHVVRRRSTAKLWIYAVEDGP